MFYEEFEDLKIGTEYILISYDSDIYTGTCTNITSDDAEFSIESPFGDHKEIVDLSFIRYVCMEKYEFESFLRGEHPKIKIHHNW